MRDEYDFSPEELRGRIRGQFAAQSEGVNLVSIDPEVAEIFSDAAAVNQALRATAAIIRAREAAD